MSYQDHPGRWVQHRLERARGRTGGCVQRLLPSWTEATLPNSPLPGSGHVKCVQPAPATSSCSKQIASLLCKEATEEKRENGAGHEGYSFPGNKEK